MSKETSATQPPSEGNHIAVSVDPETIGQIIFYADKVQVTPEMFTHHAMKFGRTLYEQVKPNGQIIMGRDPEHFRPVIIDPQNAVKRSLHQLALDIGLFAQMVIIGGGSVFVANPGEAPHEQTLEPPYGKKPNPPQLDC